MRVHVLVLNFNGRHLLAECLPSVVEAARASRHSCDVAVVDNDSSDDSIAWLAEHFPGVEVIRRPNRGLASYDDIVPGLPGPVAILLNNDIKLAKRAIDPLVAPLAGDERDAACFMTTPLCWRFDGRTYEGSKTAVRWRWGLVQATALFPGCEAGIHEPGLTAAAGSVLAVDCRKFAALGGFDPIYWPGRIEDLDLAFRAYMAGYHARYVPEAVAYHRGMGTFGEVFGQAGCDHLALRNTLLLQWKNLRHPAHLVRQVFGLALRLMADCVRAPRLAPDQRWAFGRAFVDAWKRWRCGDPACRRPPGRLAREWGYFRRFHPRSMAECGLRVQGSGFRIEDRVPDAGAKARIEDPQQNLEQRRGIVLRCASTVPRLCSRVACVVWCAAAWDSQAARDSRRVLTRSVRSTRPESPKIMAATVPNWFRGRSGAEPARTSDSRHSPEQRRGTVLRCASTVPLLCSPFARMGFGVARRVCLLAFAVFAHLIQRVLRRGPESRPHPNPLPRREGTCWRRGRRGGYIMNRPTITAAIIARDEEAHLAELLPRLNWADEIVVVDSGSCDKTREIAEAHGCRVVVRPFDTFARQRNHALSQAQGDWILSIDADERPTPLLVHEIRRRIASGPCAAYRIPIHSRLFGRRLRRSGTQVDAPIRLVRRGAAWWTGEVHEVLRVQGRVGRLAGWLEHHSTPDLATYRAKMEHYHHLAAQARVSAGLPPRWQDAVASPLRELFRRLLWKQGFLDGPAGWAFSLLSGLSEWHLARVHRRLWEIEVRGERSEVEGNSAPANSTPDSLPHRIPHSSSLIPHPSSLIPHPSSLTPHPSSLTPPTVLLAGKLTAFDSPGGGEVQMLATAEALRREGITARLWRPWEDRLDTADCVHLFGSQREHLPVVEAAHRRGVPVVLSTITWFDLASYWREAPSIRERLAAAGRFSARACLPRLPSWRRQLYHAVDLLLPNSQAEAEQLAGYFQVPAERIRVVPNGADERFAAADPAPFARLVGGAGFVLCAARIEPRKNQLGLIRAMGGTDVPLVLLGDAVPGHEDYVAACRNAADGNVRFVGRLEHDDPLLASAYAACGCLVLCGWYETPGLAALEAAMTGTPLVLPEGGCAKEYFGPDAEYVRPGDLVGIRRAVMRALARGRSTAMADRVRASFSWQAAARATWDAYQSVMNLAQCRSSGGGAEIGDPSPHSKEEACRTC